MISNNFSVDLVKTDKITVDKDSHRLPPHKGVFEEFKVADYFCPPTWTNDGVFVRIEEGQPLWFDLRMNDECACIVSVQRWNPVSNEPANLKKGLKKDPSQNYLKLPEQMWLDGYAKDGKVYQFVGTKAGEGLAVNEYVLPKHLQDSHAIGFAFFAPKVPKPKASPIPTTIIHQHYKKYAMLPQKAWNDFGDYLIDWTYMGDNFTFYNGPIGMADMGQNTSKGSSLGNNTLLNSEQVTCSVSSSTKTARPTGVLRSACFAGQMKSTPDINILEDQETAVAQASMGMGGRIFQEIVTDPNTVKYYKKKPSAILTVYLALPEQFDLIMQKGKRQDGTREDRHVHSGDIAGIPVPLI